MSHPNHRTASVVAGDRLAAGACVVTVSLVWTVNINCGRDGSGMGFGSVVRVKRPLELDAGACLDARGMFEVTLEVVRTTVELV